MKNACHPQEQVAFGPFVFSTRRPKDGWTGLASGLKSVAEGVGYGAVSLVSVPIAGAFEEGPTGFVQGLGLGIICAATLPVAGVGIGAYQLGRGIANSASGRGMMWDGANDGSVSATGAEDSTDAAAREEQVQNSVEPTKTTLCSVCYTDASEEGLCCTSNEHHFCTECFNTHARTSFEAGGIFEQDRMVGGRTSFAGELPCPYFTNGCSSASVPNSLLRRFLDESVDEAWRHAIGRVAVSLRDTEQKKAE